MERPATYILFVFISILGACDSAKQESTEALLSKTWLLEDLTNSDERFEVLFPDIIPEIQFDQESGQVVGNSGCNGYQAPYTLDGPGIRFGEPGPSTLMYCGEGENRFRESMRLADQWQVDRTGKLILLQAGQTVLRFRAKNP